MSQRTYAAVGLVGVAGVGYYLYNAGGNPKVAEKMMEYDASRASAKIKSELPGSTKQAQKKGEEWASRAGARLDNIANEVKSEGREFDAKASAKMAEADRKIGQMQADGKAKLDGIRRETTAEINKFDNTVERKAAEAKSGLSSWFGFGK